MIPISKKEAKRTKAASVAHYKKELEEAKRAYQAAVDAPLVLERNEPSPLTSALNEDATRLIDEMKRRGEKAQNPWMKVAPKTPWNHLGKTEKPGGDWDKAVAITAAKVKQQKLEYRFRQRIDRNITYGAGGVQGLNRAKEALRALDRPHADRQAIMEMFLNPPPITGMGYTTYHATIPENKPTFDDPHEVHKDPIPKPTLATHGYEVVMTHNVNPKDVKDKQKPHDHWRKPEVYQQEVLMGAGVMDNLIPDDPVREKKMERAHEALREAQLQAEEQKGIAW